MRAAYERQLQLEREGVELRRVVDSQRTFIHQRDDKIMALEQMLAQEAGERESDVRQLNAEIDGALGRQRLFEKQGAELQHVVEQQRNVLKQREDRILLLEQLHVQKDRDAKEGEEQLAEAADLLETFEARKKRNFHTFWHAHFPNKRWLPYTKSTLGGLPMPMPCSYITNLIQLHK